MSVSTLLLGSVEFMEGVDLNIVKIIVHELADNLEIEPNIVVQHEKYAINKYEYHDRNLIICHENEGVKRYVVNYEHINFSSHIYDDEWDAAENTIVSQAKIIKTSDLSLWYLSDSEDKGFHHDHEGLMEMAIKSMEDRLTGSDTDA